MMRMRPIVLLAALPLLLSACYMQAQPWLEAADVYRTSESAYPPLPEDAYVQLTTGDLDVAYEEIAIAVVWPPWNRDQRRGIFEGST